MLLTRREIIEIWKRQDDKHLDSYCCRNCRDILSYDSDNIFYCKNIECSNYGVKINEDGKIKIVEDYEK